MLALEVVGGAALSTTSALARPEDLFQAVIADEGVFLLGHYMVGSHSEA